MSTKTKARELLRGIKSFLKEHRALPIFLLLIVGLTFGLSRLVPTDTVTLKYKDENSNTQSLTLNKGSTIYLYPNFGYFKKDNDKRTKKLTLNNNLDLTNNYDSSINRYAVSKWGEESTWGKNTTFSSIRTMQEMDSKICSNETTPTKDAVDTTAVHSTNTNLVPEARLKDTRDNKYYTIRKLADGNCWMTDNLAYAKAGTLEPTGSDVQDSSFSLASSDIHTKEGEKWEEKDDKKFIFDRPNPTYDSLVKTNTNFPLKGWRKTRLSNGNISLKAIYGVKAKLLYGNLYTWYTATVGTGTQSMSDYGTNATSSICPRGWRLPPRDGTNSYDNLLFASYGLQDNSDSSTKMRSSPLDFSLAGYYHYGDGQVVNTDRRGYYWSSTIDFANGAYYLYFPSVYVIPQGSNHKAYGNSVRCVAR